MLKVPKIKFNKLQADLSAAQLPIKNVRLTKSLNIDWDWQEIPTAEQFQLAEEILRNHRIQEA